MTVDRVEPTTVRFGPNPYYDRAPSGDVSIDERSDREAEGGARQRAAAVTATERIQDRLGDVVETVVLFGSVARGDATSDSDVDLLVVVDETADFAAVDDQLLEIAYDVGLEHDCRVEVHSLESDEFTARKERGEPFVSTAVAEGESGG